jgi:hypothetical protein
MFLDLEIQILVCEKDTEMCLNMVSSLRKYDEFKNIPIYFHDDGSLSDESKHMLDGVNNSFIINKEYADSSILEYVVGYKNCEKYRLENSRISLWHKIKLFDFYFFSKTKNILCIDTDILFINEPKMIIELINKSIPFYFPDQFENSYSFSKNTKIDVLDKVNTGVFYIPNETYYDIHAIEFALNDLFTIGMANTPRWIEQSAYSHMFFKNGNYIKLNEEKYQIPNPYGDISLNVECLHFVSHPPIRNLYNTFLNKIL